MVDTHLENLTNNSYYDEPYYKWQNHLQMMDHILHAFLLKILSWMEEIYPNEALPYRKAKSINAYHRLYTSIGLEITKEMYNIQSQSYRTQF